MPKRYLKLNFLSIFFIFMLFVLGGLVRTTGSGMGCPDWPKCFGSYIPPTNADDLPDNYEEQFRNERIKKTERFAGLLRALGMEKKAEQVMAYEDLHQTHEFNAAKAYTEYINRIWGALTGLVVFVTFLSSFSLFKLDKTAFAFTLVGFITVFLNALIGAVVVNANLFANLVSIHFLLAFASVAFFMIARYRLKAGNLTSPAGAVLKSISLALLLFLLIQVAAGAQVREIYDHEINAGMDSDNIVTVLGKSFVIHRVLAFVITLFLALQWFISHRRWGNREKVSRFSLMTLSLALAQIAVGALIITGGLASISKLFHISFGAALFLLQFYICSLYFRGPKTN